MKSFLKKIAEPLFKLSWIIVPLKLRQRLAIWVGGKHWLPGYSWLAMIIIRDLADADPNAYNRFLWTNHIGFATNYEHANDFGPENLIETRVLLFDHVNEYLRANGIDPEMDITSIFEVGCSSGFLLRHMESNIFTAATIFEGIDIDAMAIARGTSYLAQHDSRIRITCADMASMDSVMGDKKYDLILCAGVLRYLSQEDASEVIRSTLHHANRLVVISGYADPVSDNASLTDSVLQKDGTLIHNIDAMVKEAGGKIHFRRWEGDRLFGGYSVYFILCSLAD